MNEMVFQGSPASSRLSMRDVAAPAPASAPTPVTQEETSSAGGHGDRRRLPVTAKVPQPTEPPLPPPPPPLPPLPWGADENNTNRKLLDLPPVVGSTIQFQNKHLKYRPVPDDLDAVREKLFKVENDLLLDSQQICDYWYHMTNVWQRSTKPVVEHNGTVSEVWQCRNRRRVKLKDSATEQKERTPQQRKRPSKDALLGDSEACKLRVKFVSYTKHAENPREPCGPPGFMNCKCIPEWLHVTRTNLTRERGYQHEHDLVLLDRFKRADALMYYSKVLVEQAYSYASVHKWLNERYGHITQQVQYLTKQDVSNVGRFWRLMHKDAELRSKIGEESDLERDRRENLDSIHHTSQKQLAKALSEICRQIPEALGIIKPFLEKPVEASTSSVCIQEAEDIIVPEPGLPLRREQLSAYLRPVVNEQPETLQPAVQPAPQRPPAAVATPSSSLETRPDASRPGQFVLSSTPTPSSSTSSIGISTRIPPPRSVQDTLSATVSYSHPDATRRAPVDASANPSFAMPYAAGSIAEAPPRETPKSMWPPTSIAYPVQALSVDQSRRGSSEWRPTWAQSTPSKRAAARSPEHHAPKRTFYEEIRTQLRSELTIIPS